MFTVPNYPINWCYLKHTNDTTSSQRSQAAHNWNVCSHYRPTRRTLRIPQEGGLRNVRYHNRNMLLRKKLSQRSQAAHNWNVCSHYRPTRRTLRIPQEGGHRNVRYHNRNMFLRKDLGPSKSMKTIPHN